MLVVARFTGRIAGFHLHTHLKTKISYRHAALRLSCFSNSRLKQEMESACRESSSTSRFKELWTEPRRPEIRTTALSPRGHGQFSTSSSKPQTWLWIRVGGT